MKVAGAHSYGSHKPYGCLYFRAPSMNGAARSQESKSTESSRASLNDRQPATWSPVGRRLVVSASLTSGKGSELAQA